MSKVNRGGLTLTTGKIGRVKCLRQQLLMPGEMMDVDINGSVRLESLRERDVMRINAHLGVFMTPLRWLWSDYPDYVKEGPDTAKFAPSFSVDDDDWSKYGAGSFSTLATGPMKAFFADNYLRVYNEWYKYPESADITDRQIDQNGEKAVPLSKAWTRTRFQHNVDDIDDYAVSAVTGFTVQELARAQARFKSAVKRDITSFNRWMELVDQMWKGSDPSREIDQVPIMLDQAEVGVSPRDLPATDGASLGQWQSLYDFNVNHSLRGIVAPEHCIVSYFLTVRFPSITETVHPLATTHTNWFEEVADPEYLAAEELQEVLARDILATSSVNSLGYLPAGWQWRTDHDVIGKQIYDRNSFPFMEPPTTSAETKDATRIKSAFRSQSLGDYLVDVYFKERSRQPIGTSMDSYFSGMLDETRNIGNTSDEFPMGGKML
jgi:hypothetical protein